MSRLVVMAAVVSVAALALGIVPASAGGSKVEVCHIPPGDPANFHTITISSNALTAHLAHGDLAGPCNDLCATICDDGDKCTVDDTGDCEQNGCPTGTRQPANCDDGNACTIDSCDATSGCASTPKTCTPSGECLISTCDPMSGACVETPDVECSGPVCGAATACAVILGEFDASTVSLSGPCSVCLGEDYSFAGGSCSGPGCDLTGACNDAASQTCGDSTRNDLCTAAVEAAGCEAVCCGD